MGNVAFELLVAIRKWVAFDQINDTEHHGPHLR